MYPLGEGRIVSVEYPRGRRCRTPIDSSERERRAVYVKAQLTSTELKSNAKLSSATHRAPGDRHFPPPLGIPPVLAQSGICLLYAMWIEQSRPTPVLEEKEEQTGKTRSRVPSLSIR